MLPSPKRYALRADVTENAFDIRLHSRRPNGDFEFLLRKIQKFPCPRAQHRKKSRAVGVERDAVRTDGFQG